MTADFDDFLSEGGEMGARIRAHDWASTPLGHPSGWAQSLWTMLGVCLNSSFPTALYWGPELTLIYNDAWSPIPGPRHPDALGKPAREVWADIWHIIEPQFEQVRTTRRGFTAFDQMLPMQRFGVVEESYWDYSFTPIPGEDHDIVGILNEGREVTARVMQTRHDNFLLTLNEALRSTTDAQTIMDRAVELLAENMHVGRAGFAEIESGGEEFVIESCWTDGTMPNIAGRHRVGVFGHDLHDAMTNGRVVTIEDLEADPGTASPDIVDVYRSIGLRSGIVAPLIEQGDYIAAVFVHDREARQWGPHDIDLVRAVARRIWQGISRARAETALRDSEERHRLIFETARDIIFTADLDQTITAANPASGAALGVDSEKLIGRSIAEFVSAEDFGRTTEMLRSKLSQGGGTTRYDVTVNAPDGREMQWEISSTLAFDRDGQPVGLHAIARDVTERRAFDERQKLLIHELNHRVKNTLALVQALALQSLKPGRDPGDAASDFQSRLRALAAAHDLLTREQWEGATLGEIVSGATQPIADRAGRVSYAGPAITITPKAAVSLVMALHELVTNATKYGALTVPDGRVSIRWSPHEGGFRLEWREENGPRVEPPSQRGFGIRMIERALAADLGGSVSVTFDPAGLSCTIEAPASAVVDPAGADG
jgi:PAS domain S-box-containing protein